MGEKGKVTIYDLAQRLHTTASTVSRALQNNPRISLKTREAVQKLAKELNYIPDPVAHHLRTGKGNVLGIIVPRIDRNFFATIISSFQDQAQKHGFQVIIAASGESITEELLYQAGGRMEDIVVFDVGAWDSFAPIRWGKHVLDNGQLTKDLSDLAARIREEHPKIGAILLECSDLPPYAWAVQEASGLPVYDFITLIRWVKNAVVQKPYYGIF